MFIVENILIRKSFLKQNKCKLNAPMFDCRETSVSKEKTEGIFTLFFSYGEGKMAYTMLYRLTFKSSCNKIKCGDKKK